MTASEQPWHVEQPHALPAEEVVRALAGNAGHGLEDAEAEHRLRAAGRNRLPEPPRQGWLRRFLKHFRDTLIYVLIAAAAVTALLGHWIDTAVIAGVVVINAVIGLLQEDKAEQALAGIRNMLSPHAHAMRGGEWKEIEAEQLVPGDIIRLRSGDRVPADVRLLEAVNLRLEESALTGESAPVHKDGSAAGAAAGLGDRRGMVFSGTLVSAGRGRGVVTATGVATEIGRIHKMVGGVRKLATPLTRQMDRFGRLLSVAIGALAIVMMGTGWWLHGSDAGELFFAAIGFAVAAIPEGLPAILTITLAVGVQRMARRNAITRRLNAVETLGSVSVICSDKTGTLTRNEMTVRQAVTGAGLYDVEGSGYAPEGRVLLDGQPVTPGDRPDLAALIEPLALCNDSQISERGGQWSLTGEPTEGALRAFERKAGFDAGGYERLEVIPFESENKFMATLHRLPAGGVRLLMKGAPDRLLDRCTAQLGTNGESRPLDRAYWEKHIDALSREGLRVLAGCMRDEDAATASLAGGDPGGSMVFLGVVGIIDPPRPEAIEAIRACREAGIRVKMITGDHAGTAAAIGRQMGIGDGQQAVTGAELEQASDEELRRLVGERDLFARTSPEHKLRLVRALQANGEVVAMTGDGVNDAPALKRADVGVAMGIKGTEATKEAADIVLADDNFASIERAVEEGRTIYDNLRKAILFILPTNGAEALVVFAAVVFGFALPMTPVQILWVNMVTAVTLAMALGFEPPEPGLMQRPPRQPDAPILGTYFLWRIGFVSALIGGAAIAVFLVEKQMGIAVDTARTVAVNTLVMGQVFYLFNSRGLRASSLRAKGLFANRAVWTAVGVLAVLQALFVYAPWMQLAFGSAPLSARHWLVPVLAGLAVFLAVEAEKTVLRRFTRSTLSSR